MAIQEVTVVFVQGEVIEENSHLARPEAAKGRFESYRSGEAVLMDTPNAARTG